MTAPSRSWVFNVRVMFFIRLRTHNERRKYSWHFLLGTAGDESQSQKRKAQIQRSVVFETNNLPGSICPLMGKVIRAITGGVASQKEEKWGAVIWDKIWICGNNFPQEQKDLVSKLNLKSLTLFHPVPLTRGSCPWLFAHPQLCAYTTLWQGCAAIQKAF